MHQPITDLLFIKMSSDCLIFKGSSQSNIDSSRSGLP